MALSSIQLYGRSTEQNLNEFNRYSTFVENLYTSNLAKIELTGIRKIVIELLDKDIYEGVTSSIVGTSPICTLQRAFDFSAFFEKETFEKKKNLVEVLHDSLKQLSKELKWDETLFVHAYHKIVNANFENRTLIGKTKWNKGKKIQAGIIVDHDIDKATIAVVFRDERSEIRRVEIFKTIPQPFIYTQLISNGRWINETDFELISKSAELHIITSPYSNVPTVFLTPSNREADGLMEEVNFLLQGNLPIWFKSSS